MTGVTSPTALRDLTDDRRASMAADVVELASINSGTRHVAGVDRVAAWVVDRLCRLGAGVARVAWPPVDDIDDAAGVDRWTPAPAVVGRVRPDAATRLLLNIHLDTVFPPDAGFDDVRWVGDARLHGPGVADAKGGAVVMLAALEAYERAAASDPRLRRLGWTAVFNTDEEVGSPASTELLRREASGHAMGLVYEPALPSGRWIGARKGSGNFTLVVRGRAAHAGRDFSSGRNAVLGLCRAMDAAAGLTDVGRGVTVNVAKAVGGGPSNVVPALAVGRINARVTRAEDVAWIEGAMREVVGEAAGTAGCTAELTGRFFSPPKPMDAAAKAVHRRVAEAAGRVGLAYATEPSGGVCDGNKLAAAGCPCVDTMGPVGGSIHSHDEWLDVASLVPRARVTLELMTALAEEAGDG
jgi:glutamate carboxypeptidase